MPITPLAVSTLYASRWVSSQTLSRLTFQLSIDAANTQPGKWYVEESNDPVVVSELQTAATNSIDSKATLIDISNSPRVRIEGANGLGVQSGPVNMEIIVTNPARFTRLRFESKSPVMARWQPEALAANPPLALWVTAGQ